VSTILHTPNPPSELTVLDQAQAYFHKNGNIRLTVHLLKLFHLAPRSDKPLLVINHQVEKVTILKFEKYHFHDGQLEEHQSIIPKWVPLIPHETGALSQIKMLLYPHVQKNDLVDIQYILKPYLNNHKSTHSSSPWLDSSFAFQWQSFFPSLKRELDIAYPRSLNLYVTRPPNYPVLQIVQKKHNAQYLFQFIYNKYEPGLAQEAFDPPIQDLSSMISLTIHPSWESALKPFLKRIRPLLSAQSPFTHVVQFFKPVKSGSFHTPFQEILKLKERMDRKIKWVNTDLPIYLDPLRSLKSIVKSHLGSSLDKALIFYWILKKNHFSPTMYLYRNSFDGNLNPETPTLAQFNGILIRVPTNTKFIWLDPSEALAAPNVLPYSALDVPALAVKRTLQWIKTPNFNLKNNYVERDIIMRISNEGTLTCTVTLRAYGSEDLALRKFFRETNPLERKMLVQKGLATQFPNAKLLSYNGQNYKKLSHPFKIHYQFQVAHYAHFLNNGKFYFYFPTFGNIEMLLSSLTLYRKNPVALSQNFNSISRIIVQLPYQYKVKHRPNDLTFSNAIVNFTSHSKIQFGTLIDTQRLRFKRPLIRLGKPYQKLLAFYKAVIQQDRSPCLVVQKHFYLSK
jgi:hypothetical protein